MLKVLVTGGRDYADKRHVFDVFDALREEHGEDFFIIQGGAAGADALAAEYARVTSMPCAEVKAPWTTLPRYVAGPRRNGWMLLLEPDLLVPFPGGRGTANMVAQAEAAGVPLHI